MDLDAYVNAKRPSWDRLETLTRQRRLTAAESDELIDTYQRVATQLSVIRSSAPDPELVGYLSALLAKARNRAAGTRVGTWSALGRYFGRTFPAALYAMRWWWLTTLVVSMVVTVALGWHFLEHPRVESAFGSAAEIEQLVNHDFADYYSEHAASAFAFRVWSNNFWLAAMCIAFGVFGFPVIIVLWQNCMNLAITGSIMIRHGRADVFFGLITPHGLLEMTCLFVAAGVGLRVFWSWVAPGDKPRLQSLAEQGRAAIGIALGLVVLLGITGIIEAFVTPSSLPTWARIAVGVAVWVGFFVYVFVIGRWAHHEGERGDIDEADRDFYAPSTV
ncbi:stage II sporulation protein M [Gordonia sp. NB41Y]|uniref:stage II sporulation protein M n=1 Tax=Gordonia sp. NB41Y TaxID=875808 RepID=UPI0002BEE24A|nr:stage II sporulation protein M [Gordonia sp. NB41Y]EMP14620.1 membrane protein [Gordonia sp. NB41Y]WLP88564.1 stage II sporulation protein M [Gordonia sp. NB41Y]